MLRASVILIPDRFIPEKLIPDTDDVGSAFRSRQQLSFFIIRSSLCHVPSVIYREHEWHELPGSRFGNLLVGSRINGRKAD